MPLRRSPVSGHSRKGPGGRPTTVSGHTRKVTGSSGNKAQAASLSKQERLRAIASMLETQGASSQQEIVEMLLEKGATVTQPTVGRDLKEIGAFKVRDGKEVVYTLDEQAQTPFKLVEVHLRKVFGEWVRQIQKSHNLIAIQTAPGAAHVVAAALDRSKYPGVLATVSGDDTVLVVVKETSNPERLLQSLRDLAGFADNADNENIAKSAEAAKPMKV